MSTNPEDVLSDEIDSFEDLLSPAEEEEEIVETTDQPADESDEAGNEEGDEEETSDEDEADAPEAVKAPHSWSKEDKAVFEKLDPAAQSVIARREEERDKFVRAKAFEASQTREQVATEAQQVIAKMYENHATALQVYAQQFTVQPPDQRLLYSNNPDDVLSYQRQEAAYRASADQQQSLHQQIAQAQAAADHARTQAQQAELVSDAQRLHEQLPEWNDPSEGPKLKQVLQSIGSELGYPVELMANASSTDIMALKKVADLKSEVEELRSFKQKIMGSKMEAVRAAKGLPKMARPGVKPPKGQVNATARDQAWSRVKETKNPGDMADWLEKSGFM